MFDSAQEAAWIAAIRRGDQEAFEHLVRRYQQMIHALTYRMSGSASDAEDLAQEIFLRAYRQLGGYRGDAKFSSWLYRIGINTCLNWRKRRQRRDQLHEEFARQDVGAEPASDLAERVQAALLKLAPKQRAAIVLTVYEEMSHAEAAKVLGCSETTVSWRVFMARKQLKGWLRCD